MLQWREMTKSQWLALVLGLFELVVAVPTQLMQEKRIVSKKQFVALLPRFFFEDKAGIAMFAAIGLLLGFQRLGYACLSTGKGNDEEKRGRLFWPWVALVSTHCAEVWFWYSCAMDQPYWVSKTGFEKSPRDIFLAALLGVATSGEVGLQSFVILCGVPLVTACFAFWGP